MPDPITPISKINGAEISALSASYALTASYAENGGGSGVTINNNVDNYLITATGNTNTLNGESNLQFNGSTLTVTGNITATSITGSLTGSLFGTASWAQSASQAISSITSSYPIRVTGSVIYSVDPASKTPNPTTDGSSIFLGSNAGLSTGAANENSVCIGTNAGSGSGNLRGSVNIGSSAGVGISNTNNISIGTLAGNNATNAQSSTFLGNSAGRNAISASYSNFIGYFTGYAVTSSLSVGSNNIIIGTGITLPPQRKDSINIGGIIFGTGSISNVALIPVSSSANGRIGINVVNPIYTLDVSGSGNYTNGLTVTGSIIGSLIGTASWAQSASQAISSITSSYPIATISSSIYSTSPTSGIPTDLNNIWLGTNAGLGNTKQNNIFLGQNAGSGSNNAISTVAIGSSAGQDATSAGSAVFIGTSAGVRALSAGQSNFIGASAGGYAEQASESNFIGTSAGTFATSASFSVFIGGNAGGTAIKANNSNFIGYQAGYNAISASYSVLIGDGAGRAAITASSIGSNNIIIGNNITLAPQRKDSINIGGIIFGTGSNSTIGGSPFTGSANGRIGINVVTPTYSLDTSGSLFSGSIARFSSDIVVATRSAAPSVGVEGQMVPVQNGANYLLYVYIGGRWRSSSLF
jgi:hypothetical protein